MACVWKIIILLNIFIVSGISSNVLTGMSSNVLRSWFGLDLTLKTNAHILSNMFIEEQRFRRCFTIMNLLEHGIMCCF